jgi:hypothetical protein
MGLGRAEARIEDAERRAFLKRNVLQIIDKQDNNRLIGTVRSWNKYKLSGLRPGQPTFRFLITERNDGISTAENLSKYAIAYNGEVHEVITRNIPDVGYYLWEFLTSPNGERIA